jgi:hypothetical protein
VAGTTILLALSAKTITEQTRGAEFKRSMSDLPSDPKRSKRPRKHIGNPKSRQAKLNSGTFTVKLKRRSG